MSSPTKINASPVGAREGQRVILREITTSIHNSPPSMNISDVITKVSPDHEVKVKFAREFGDVVNYPPPPTINVEANSISTASSFQSLTSTFSTKSNSSISATDALTKINDSFNLNSDVSDLDDLISACAAIHLNDTTVITGEQSFTDATFTSATDEINKIHDLFASGCNSPNSVINSTQIINNDLNESETIYERLNPDFNSTQHILSQDTEKKSHQDSYVKALTEQNTSPDYATANESLLQSVSLLDDVKNNDKNVNNTFAVPLPPKEFIQLNEPSPPAIKVETFDTVDVTEKDSDITSTLQSSTLPSLPSILLKNESREEVESENSYCDLSQTPVDTFSNTPVENSSSEDVLQLFPNISTNNLTAIKEPTFIETQNLFDTNTSGLTEPTAQSIVVKSEILNEDCVIAVNQVKQERNELSIEVSPNQQTNNINKQLNQSGAVEVNEIPTETASIDVTTEENALAKFTENLDTTIDIDDINSNSLDGIEAENYKDIALDDQNTNIETVAKINSEIISQKHEDYNNFLPPRQSTCLNDLLPSDINSKLPLVNNSAITETEFFDAHGTSISDNQIDFENSKLNTSLDLVNDHDHMTNTSTDLWRDPTNFDFLLSKKANSATTDRLRAESLYVKFDPLVSNISMLPQGNGATAPPNEERNGEKEVSMPNIGTPKRNSAIAAIDRLLFYSPMTPANQRSEEPKKIEPTEKTTPEAIPIVDPVMAKELEIVRATVLQLEEQLEKQKLENDRQQKEHKVDREAFQEAITQLQKQLNQEIKSKNQINVVVDEYEKSISRLVAEKERDRKNLDVEKASLLEELQEVKNHLSASEAAFNDVHAKYERLKVVVTASKNNEAALKGSIAENVEIIKILEDRYDQIKTHAAVRLDKANLELEGIRKQHESETLKLRAMLRKEELKSSSLAEMIEQKTKENKELTKILDEVIARVDPGADK